MLSAVMGVCVCEGGACVLSAVMGVCVCGGEHVCCQLWWWVCV